MGTDDVDDVEVTWIISKILIYLYDLTTDVWESTCRPKRYMHTHTHTQTHTHNAWGKNCSFIIQSLPSEKKNLPNLRFHW